jgi:hypothetical protein
VGTRSPRAVAAAYFVKPSLEYPLWDSEPEVFDRTVRSWSATGEHHAGVLFTSPRRFHRGSRRYPANLVAALRGLLADPPAAAKDWVYWLP